MKITQEEAQRIVYEDHDNFEVVEDNIVDTSRWSEIHEIVVRQISTQKLFGSHYTQGLTEQQDESPYEYEDNPEFWEVVAKEVMVTQYVKKKGCDDQDIL